MTETTERFLQEIAARVGYDRVAELYLFPVLRQGGVEGAVAVVAAYPELAPPEVTPEVTPEGEAGEAAQSPEARVEDGFAADASADESEIETAAADEALAQEGAGAVKEPSAHDETAEPSEAGESDDAVDSGDATNVVASAEAAAEAHAEAHADARIARPERARHVVYTARYRHTIKGTDRGRWVVEVVAEADAPLITVEEVVRGVVRRSGDAFQPERISGDQFRAIVPAPAAP